jgi:hypothetical protein
MDLVGWPRQFTRELFLHVADVHINLVIHKKTYSNYINLQTDNRAQLVPQRNFWVFGSLQALYMQNLHGFKRSLNDQRVIRKHTAKIQILVFEPFFEFVFESGKKRHPRAVQSHYFLI